MTERAGAHYELYGKVDTRLYLLRRPGYVVSDISQSLLRPTRSGKGAFSAGCLVEDGP